MREHSNEVVEVDDVLAFALIEIFSGKVDLGRFLLVKAEGVVCF